MDRILLSFDEYFMGVALLSAFRSRDPSCGVGACIVNKKNRIVGVGYNGFPNGCPEDALPQAKEGGFLDTKYAYTCHAELNAILNSHGDLDGCRMYLSLFPCNECAKAIIQAGICEVVYLSDYNTPEIDIFVAARRLFDLSGVKYKRLSPSINSLLINFQN